MSKAQIAKFSGKKYVSFPGSWTVEDHTTDLSFAAEDDLALYVVAIQLAYVPEDKSYSCLAEFFKIPIKKVDYKAYQLAKKEVESYKDDEDDEADPFPSYTEKQWTALSAAEKFDLLEPFLEVDSLFEIESEDFDAFVKQVQQAGIEIPASLKNDLKK